MGAEENIINEIMSISEAKEVRGTYGIYDVFCKVESDSKEILDEVITNKIRKIPSRRYHSDHAELLHFLWLRIQLHEVTGNILLKKVT